MAKSVNDAFASFLSDTVNLDPAVTKTARASRDWLRDQLLELPGKYPDFPFSFEEWDIDFGSFSRRTKIRLLDDIDLISCMHAQGGSYFQEFGGAISVTVRSDSRFVGMCDDGTYQLNSRKVINRFVRSLEGIPQYRRADIGRNGEAAVLDLHSYSWSFDIVPGFFTSPEANGRTYYLIPDGNGRWKKTDPRIDQERVTRINQVHSGRVLDPIRIAKFWNRHRKMVTIPPYLLESIILAHYERAAHCHSFVDLEVAPVLRAIASAIIGPVWDPKGIQGDLNSLAPDDRFSIATRATLDAAVADEAWAAEQSGDHKKAIGLWGSIFGVEFPSYE